MRKKGILILLLGVFFMAVLVACQDSQQEASAPSHQFEQADMSGYDVPEEHRFYSVSMSEALELINENFDGILYFGFPGCPWCQAAVPIMHDASRIANIDIFYVSRAHDLRYGGWLEDDASMAWWLYENGVENMAWLYTTPDEDATDEEIEEFVPERIRPNINVPQIVHLRRGEVLGNHRGTVDGHMSVESELPQLTAIEIDELRESYIDIFVAVGEIEGCTIGDLSDDDEGCS